MRSLPARLRRGHNTPTHPAFWIPATAVALTVVVWSADPYHQLTIARILALGLLAASVALLTGIAGLPTLGQVAPFAIGAYTTALLARSGITVGVVQLTCAAAAAGLFAAAVGALVIRTRGTVCLMVTLAIGELTAIAAGQWRGLTGGTDGLAGIPAVRPIWGLPPAITDGAVAGYVLAVTLIALTAVVMALRSPAGILLTGVRDNEARMRANGHTVTRYLLTAHIGAGILAGIGGSLLVAVQRFFSPADAGFDVAALTLLAVIIGGATSIPAAMIGLALVVLLRDEWTLPGHGPLLLGLAFIAAVYLLPDGLVGLRKRRPHRPPLITLPARATAENTGTSHDATRS